MPTRRLTSNLWVWYPSILSRAKSFHQAKEIIIVSKTDKITEDKDNFKLRYKTKLPINEKSVKETKIGQKEVWTAKKGLK